jgi:hypothetical protein
MRESGKAVFALFVQLEDDYGQAKLKTRVMTVQPDGDLNGLLWGIGGFDPGAEYAGLEINAYVADNASWGAKEHPMRGVWGHGVHYELPQVENARHAKAIASVLSRIERGLERLTQERGFLQDCDYAGLVLRVARILKINRVHVRNPRAVRERTGQFHRRVTAVELQSWVLSAVEDVEQGNRLEHTR